MNELEAAKTLDIFFNPTKTPASWSAVDRIETYISDLPDKVTGNVEERGTPGLYTREITLPAGTLLTSKIHKSHHQFIVSKGSISVYNTLDDSTVLIMAPYHGITYPGTRRVLYTFEDTVWTTFHPTNRIKFGFDALDTKLKQSIFDEVMADILQDYYNPLLTDFEDGIFI